MTIENIKYIPNKPKQCINKLYIIVAGTLKRCSQSYDKGKSGRDRQRIVNNELPTRISLEFFVMGTIC